jgi:muramoyltetrapeptide carboxypeptidase
MIQPPILKPNDTVAIVAPGRKLDAITVNEAVTIIQSWGLNVRLGNNLFQSNHAYLSGTDEQRLEDLQTALNDDSISAIICARGGYGTTRILDQIDFHAFQKNPKWICGFSDITSLHLTIQRLGVQSIHGTMPVLFSKTDSAKSLETLRLTLFGKQPDLEAAGTIHNRAGTATGQLVGGNLSLITDSLGTSSEIDTSYKILLIEEIDEYFYKMDRMLVQLKRAGKFEQLAGLAIGHMTDIKETEIPFKETIENIVLTHTREYNFPVAFRFPFGHENPNLAFTQGRPATLTVSKENSSIRFS